MKKSKKIIVMLIALLVVLLFIPLNFTNADSNVPNVVQEANTSEIMQVDQTVPPTDPPTDSPIEISTVNITLSAPKDGDKVLPIGWTGENIENIVDDGTMEPDSNPDAKSTTQNVKVDCAYWVKDTDNYDPLFFGMFKADTYYYADINISTSEGYMFADGVTIKVNGQNPVEVFGLYDGVETHFIAKIKAVADETKIKKIDLTVTLPEIGTTIDETAEPTVTIGEGVNCEIGFLEFVNCYPSQGEYDDGTIFGKKIEEGKDYYLGIFLKPKEGYKFYDKKGVTVTVNGKNDFELGYCSEEQFALYTKVTAQQAKVLYKILEGGSQKVDISKVLKLVLRFNIEYADFLASGKVFVDGDFCPSKNYDSSEGSTIISFKPEYLKTLSEGKHNVVVTVANGEATTDFTIIRSVKNNVETGDNIVVFAVALSVAVVGFAVVTIVSKKHKSKVTNN